MAIGERVGCCHRNELAAPEIMSIKRDSVIYCGYTSLILTRTRQKSCATRRTCFCLRLFAHTKNTAVV